MNVTEQAKGHWGHILPALGIPREWMTQRGKPCLMCHGTDRSSYDDKDGRGTYICRHCGAGDGFTLLQKYRGWDFKQTAEEVQRVLGTPDKWEKPLKPEKLKTSDLALNLWESARENNVNSHTYARAKGIKYPCGARRGAVTGSIVGMTADCLIVPSRLLSGEVVGIEAINPQGKKQSFGTKSLLILGNDLDPLLDCLIFEGWASAVKWLDYRKWNAMAVISFGKTRQEKIGRQIEDHYRREVVIAEEVD